jgi:hypothetical protein
MLRPGMVSLCGREGGVFEGGTLACGQVDKGEIREWQKAPET